MWFPSLVSAVVLLMQAVLVVTARSESCNVTQVYHMNTLHQMQQFSNHDGTGTGDVTCARTLRELSALQGDVRNMSDRQMQILDQTAHTDSNATMESLQAIYHSILSDLKKMAGAMNYQFVRLSQRLDAMENVTSSAFDNQKTPSDLSKLSGAMNNQFVQLSQRLDAMENTTSSVLDSLKTASDLSKLSGGMNSQFVQLSQRLDAIENVTSSAFVQFSQRLDTMENVRSSAIDNQKTASDLGKLSGAMNNQFVQLSQRLDAIENTTSSVLDSHTTASDLSKLSDAMDNQFVKLSQRLNVIENASASTTESLRQVYDMLKLLMDAQNRKEQSDATMKNVTDASLGHPSDCEGVFLKGHNLSGVYSIWPKGSPRPVRVYCEMGTKKWTVIMRRFDGSVSFEETWDRYKWGFGTATGEYWLGLEYMHLLTKQRDMKLRFDMTEWESGNSYYAVFHPFTIANSSLNYRIYVERRAGTAKKNRFTHANNMPFTAKDNDNDSSSDNCAVRERGGWWHRNCANALPTGPYRRTCSLDICMTWNAYGALNRVTMKLARV